MIFPQKYVDALMLDGDEDVDRYLNKFHINMLVETLEKLDLGELEWWKHTSV